MCNQLSYAPGPPSLKDHLSKTPQFPSQSRLVGTSRIQPRPLFGMRVLEFSIVFNLFQAIPSYNGLIFVFAVCIKADLDGTMFAYVYCTRLACVITSRQIVSCKLDP